MYAILITLVVLGSCAVAAPVDEPVPIVSQTQEGPNPDGSYKWAYEAGNGIKAQEEGQLTNPGSENEANSVKGGYSYTGSEGETIELTYEANENGFQPRGAHLPTAPPIPELIQKALDWIAAHPSKEDANNV
ncbi:endocuticle structural glycoprotein ABD-4-like [Cephus cinctus]|uniref:Endocuticle structural glycoprotein ABD-4-like n=1 Tax=Cephus cinctus TaxID=211228 RepID=A0AAJ7BW73_CEPCN|nr:endocuticle structural glycoprotein ABD-4-like [Cephus cinctus]